MLHPVYPSHQKKPKHPGHIRQLGPCPHPALYFPTVTQTHHHARPSTSFTLRSPHTLSKTAIPVPFVFPYPALYVSRAHLLSILFLSWYAVYCPHENVNRCKRQEGKDSVDTVSPMTSTMLDINSVFNRD